MSELTTIARPYAVALHKIAVEQKVGADWLGYIKNFAAIAQHEVVAAILLNPTYSQQNKLDCFLQLMTDLPAKLQQFLEVLAVSNRLALLPEISKLLFELYNIEHQIIEAELIVTSEVSADFLIRLKQNISQRYQAKQVIVNVTIDKTIIGGGVLKVGDDVLDVSLRTKLSNLAKQMSI